MENYQKLKEVIQAANPEKFNPLGVLRGTELSTKAITLADVLLALQDVSNAAEGYGVDVLGEFYKILYATNEVQFLGAEWNLEDDNLDHQSDETKTFLIDLLVNQ